MLTGKKVTLYKTFICPKCKKAYEFENETLMKAYQEAVSTEDRMIILECPHCKHKRNTIAEICLEVNTPYRIEID